VELRWRGGNKNRRDYLADDPLHFHCYCPQQHCTRHAEHGHIRPFGHRYYRGGDSRAGICGADLDRIHVQIQIENAAVPRCELLGCRIERDCHATGTSENMTIHRRSEWERARRRRCVEGDIQSKKVRQGSVIRRTGVQKEKLNEPREIVVPSCTVTCDPILLKFNVASAEPLL
jgi:hypothetical protein